jgi:ribosome-associated protein YbcJ (S4-like RNA binding protein)
MNSKGMDGQEKNGDVLQEHEVKVGGSEARKKKKAASGRLC